MINSFLDTLLTAESKYKMNNQPIEKEKRIYDYDI